MGAWSRAGPTPARMRCRAPATRSASTRRSGGTSWIPIRTLSPTSPNSSTSARTASGSPGRNPCARRALEFMLARDSDGDGLVEMMTDDHTAQRGSDWIDIIWASHENAFVNAKMYYALVLWAEREAYLGDTAHAVRYRNAAAKLKSSYNRTTIDGGFWDTANSWYVHWRDRDGSVHGNNLVTYLNFMAIAYGLCDDPIRTRVILGRIETEMERNTCSSGRSACSPTRRAKDSIGSGRSRCTRTATYSSRWARWPHVHTRALTQRYRSATSVNLLDRYRKDGLAFQRYLRKDQTGAGDDILAGNAMAVVGCTGTSTD